ncbi:hypothetical protein KQH27_00030 [bacterium]|nr:hypothetical protein [bacterium]
MLLIPSPQSRDEGRRRPRKIPREKPSTATCRRSELPLGKICRDNKTLYLYQMVFFAWVRKLVFKQVLKEDGENFLPAESHQNSGNVYRGILHPRKKGSVVGFAKRCKQIKIMANLSIICKPLQY